MGLKLHMEDRCIELAILHLYILLVYYMGIQYYVKILLRDALAALNITKLAEVNASC